MKTVRWLIEVSVMLVLGFLLLAVVGSSMLECHLIG